MRTTRQHAQTSLAIIFVTAALVVLGAPGVAGARTSSVCPARAHTIVKATLGRVWRSGRSLYGCTTVYGVRPRTVRLGPWAAGARVAFDGVGAAWTVPHRLSGGDVVDRAWAGSAQTGKRWLSGTPLVPASGTATARREASAAWIEATDAGAAWITDAGDLVLALHEPNEPPTAIGTLPAPLQPAKNLLLVGSWPAAAVDQLVASVKLEELPGEGDECGGVNDYRITVRPDAAGTAVGAAWNGYWTRPDCG